MFLPQEIIVKKRDNIPLTKEEISYFIKGISDNSITDAQISAFAMAVIFNKLSSEELVNLTLSMRDSGEVIKWSNLNGPIVDKHSTGGIGDLTSLMLAPILAACGAFVPMIAGRGLGHTGGTLDKLESIIGYNIFQETEQFKKIVSKIGCAIIGQTANLAPADKRVYAVRDTTGTTESLELIISSILSKKLAAGLESLVMDVKTGNGAFLTTLEESLLLANNIVKIGNSAGCNTSAIITDMNQPLASSAGNALEIIYTINYLKGDFSNKRLHKVVIQLAIAMLKASKICVNNEDATKKIMQVINSGKALEIFSKMIFELGGPVDFIEKYNQYLPKASIVRPVYASKEGVVSSINTKRLGLCVVGLGGGRLKVTDKIDYSVGLTNIVSLGEQIVLDRPLAIIHANSEKNFNFASKSLLESIEISCKTTNVKIPEVVLKNIN